MYQQNMRQSQRKNQISRVNSKLVQQDKSTSPSMQSRQQVTPKRKQQFSLPKFDSTNNYLQQPITREQMLKFLDQVVFAVENAQCILSQSDNVQNKQPQNICQSLKKFKITQEQQTDHSYIQQQLKSKLHLVNKKTQTPNRIQSYHQEDEFKNCKKMKQNIEFSGESDATEKQFSKLPNISQKASTVKQKINKIIPDGTKNRIQSQIFYNQFQQNQKGNKKKSSQYIQGFQQESHADYSNNLNSSSQIIRSKTEQSEKYQKVKAPEQIKLDYQDEYQKKQKIIPTKEQSQLYQTTKTNEDLQNMQNSTKDQQNQSAIVKLSNDVPYKITEQNLISSQTFDRNQNSQQNSVQQENSLNIEVTQKIKKRPIHIKQTNLSNNHSYQNDEKELSQISNQQDKSILKSLELNQISNTQNQNHIDPIQNNEGYSQINDEKISQIKQNSIEDKKDHDNQLQNDLQQINSSEKINVIQEQKQVIQDIQNKDPIINQQSNLPISNNQLQKHSKIIENEEFYFEPEEETKMVSKLQPKQTKPEDKQENKQELMNKTSSTVKSVYLLNKGELQDKGNLQEQQAYEKSQNHYSNNIEQNNNQNLKNENSLNQMNEKNSIPETQKQDNQIESEKKNILTSDLEKSQELVKQEKEKSIQANLKQISIDQQEQQYNNQSLNQQLNFQPIQQTQDPNIQNQSLKKSMQGSQHIGQNSEENQNLGLKKSQIIDSQEKQEKSKQLQQDQNDQIKVSQEQINQINLNKIEQISVGKSNHDLLQKDTNQKQSEVLSNRSIIQSKLSNDPNNIQEIDTNLKSKI